MCFIAITPHPDNNNIRPSVLEYFLERTICNRPSCPTVGGLFCKVTYPNYERFVLPMLINELGEDIVWDFIQKVLTKHQLPK